MDSSSDIKASTSGRHVMYPFHHESSGSVKTSPEDVFQLLDSHTVLAAHMERRSLMMGGGSMSLNVDAQEGRAVGSRLRLHGSAFGITLDVEEVVTEREPPVRKTWETIGNPRLLVIGPYRMGFEVMPGNGELNLRIFIDYALPADGLGRWLGRLLGRRYAAWCTDNMLKSVQQHFDPR